MSLRYENQGIGQLRQIWVQLAHRRGKLYCRFEVKIIGKFDENIEQWNLHLDRQLHNKQKLSFENHPY